MENENKPKRLSPLFVHAFTNPTVNELVCISSGHFNVLKCIECPECGFGTAMNLKAGSIIPQGYYALCKKCKEQYSS